MLTFDDADSQPASMKCCTLLICSLVDGGGTFRSIDVRDDVFMHGFCGKIGAGGFGGANLSCFSCSSPWFTFGKKIQVNLRN